MLFRTSVAKSILACFVALVLAGGTSLATPASGNDRGDTDRPVLLVQAKSQGKQAPSKSGGKAPAEPKWLIASVESNPRAYIPGEPITIKVGLRDETRSATHKGSVALEVQWRYSEASGKTLRSARTLELGPEIGPAD